MLTPWVKLWVVMWAVIVAVLIPAAFVLEFWQWWTCAALMFGVPEFIGSLRQDDALPPLTHVIVRYVHPELGMAGLQLLLGSIGAYWFGFPHPFRLGALVGFSGWLTAHFLPRWLNRGRRP